VWSPYTMKSHAGMVWEAAYPHCSVFKSRGIEYHEVCRVLNMVVHEGEEPAVLIFDLVGCGFFFSWDEYGFACRACGTEIPKIGFAGVGVDATDCRTEATRRNICGKRSVDEMLCLCGKPRVHMRKFHGDGTDLRGLQGASSRRNPTAPEGRVEDVAILYRAKRSESIVDVGVFRVAAEVDHDLILVVERAGNVELEPRIGLEDDSLPAFARDKQDGSGVIAFPGHGFPKGCFPCEQWNRVEYDWAEQEDCPLACQSEVVIHH